jgi:hypothetical protein
LFKKVQEILGGGYITIRPNYQSARFTIKKKIILLKLINLINGYMRTHKNEALHRLIDYLNIKQDSKLIKHEIDKSQILNNSWISGFIEADRSFYLSFKLSPEINDVNTKIISVIYYMELSQRQFYTRKVDSSVKIPYF